MSFSFELVLMISLFAEIAGDFASYLPIKTIAKPILLEGVARGGQGRNRTKVSVIFISISSNDLSLFAEIAGNFASYLPRKNHRETDPVGRVARGGQGHIEVSMKANLLNFAF